jgi:hypothetical protein
MTPNMDHESEWAAFDELGVEEVRKRLGSTLWGPKTQKLAREWLLHHEASQSSLDNAAILEEAKSANAIAREAAATARESAEEARNANRTARLMLIAATIAAVASIIGAVHSCTQGDHHDEQTETKVKTH